MTVGMPDGQVLGSLGALREVFDVRPEDAEADWPDNACLCGVDVPAILDRAGVEWSEDITDYMVEKVRGF